LINLAALNLNLKFNTTITKQIYRQYTVPKEMEYLNSRLNIRTANCLFKVSLQLFKTQTLLHSSINHPYMTALSEMITLLASGSGSLASLRTEFSIEFSSCMLTLPREESYILKGSRMAGSQNHKLLTHIL
jgi:hypothetical protein